MRKLLISILIVLLLFITVYSVWKGLSIGNIKILSFNNIKSESEKLDTGIADITKLKEQTYKKTLSDIESNAKTLLKEKQDYADIITTSTDSEIQKATHSEKYEQDFLWAKIGNHATAMGVKLKFDIKVGAVNKENYDLYFEVTGKYTNITEFVMALENDNLLGFKIENFKLLPVPKKENTNTTNTTNKNTSNNTNTVENPEEKNKLIATFKVTDISINLDKTKVTMANKLQAQVNDNTIANNTVADTNTVSSGNVTTEGTVQE